MSYQVAAARKRLLAELGYAAQVAEHGVADIDRGAREIRFVEGALQQSAGGQNNIPRAGAQAQRENQKT
jgi:hypothetical protein